MRIRVAHLYPDYLNIYADRGNIAVLARRAALRGHELDVTGVGPGDALEPGGGRPRLRRRRAGSRAGAHRARSRRRVRGDRRRPSTAGAALLAVCGGYQLLGRGYRGRDGSWMPGAGLFPHETVAGERRMIGDVLLECELAPGERQHRGRLREPRRAHAARPGRRAARPRRGRLRQRRRLGLRGVPCRQRDRHVPARARCCRATRGSPTGCSRGARARDGTDAEPLEPLPDELETLAHAVSAQRARDRGGGRS